MYILLLNNPPPFRKISVLIKGGILFSQNFYTKKSLKRKNPKIEDGLIKGGDFIEQQNVSKDHRFDLHEIMNFDNLR